MFLSLLLNYYVRNKIMSDLTSNSTKHRTFYIYVSSDVLIVNGKPSLYLIMLLSGI